MNHLYTVGEVAEETGVSIKTLHYYQKIGILLPDTIGENGYRYYSNDNIKTLQEILLYRTMGFPLKEIRSMMRDDGTDRLQRLEHQLGLLKESVQETQVMMQTIEKSIQAERKEITMKKEEMFEGVQKEDDGIYRSMQNVMIMFNKPFSLVFFILGIAMVIMHGRSIIIQEPIFGTDPSQAIIISIGFVVLGVISILVSGYNLFFVKTKDLLDVVNSKYIHKSNYKNNK